MNKKIFYFLMVMVLTVFSGKALAQSPQNSEKQKNIVAIEIKGNNTIASATIFAKIKSRVGAAYFENVVSDDIKRLYETGFFKDINIEVEDFEGGVKIIFKVEERPILEKIVFIGNKAIKEFALKKDLKSKEGQYIDYAVLKDDIESIKKLYEKRGFSLVSINYKEDFDAKTNKSKIAISITEKNRVKVRMIDFEGNNTFKDKRLIKIIKTREAALFCSGFFKEDVFAEDIEKLKSFYIKEGFSDVVVDYKVDYGQLDSIYITINIKEGFIYFVQDITLKGNTVFTEKEIIKKLVNAGVGMVYSQEAAKKDAAIIQEMYFDKGYIFGKADYNVFADPESHKVSVTYDIVENEVAYVNMIKIKGNVKTKDMVIRRELRIKPGDRFDGAKLKRSKERLQNLGFFDEQEGINYDIQDTSEPNKKDLVVDVKETKTGEFSFGGGYSTVDKLVGFVQVEQKNFDWKNWPYFTGAGQNLRLRAEVGSISNDFVLSFTEPWIFDYPLSFGFDGYRTSHVRAEDVGYGYDEIKTGFDLRLVKELTDYFKTFSTYRLDNVKISNMQDEATEDLKKEIGENVVSSLLLGGTYDSRDNVFSPNKGDVMGASVECAGGPFGGDKDFTKIIAHFDHFTPLPLKSTFETRLFAGVANQYGSSDDVPIYERFFAGGANTIRGYHERKVGPIDPVTEDPIGGKSILVANFEYLYPVVDVIKVAAFYDIGNVWRKTSDITSLNDLKSGIGLGLRIKTPLGPMKLDYGFPLKLEPGEEGKGGRFHFSAGSTF